MDVRVIAHRGDFTKYQENTLGAIRYALKHGADGVEIDIRLTKDLVPVLFHDTDLKRLLGVDGKVSDYTYDELKQFKYLNTIQYEDGIHTYSTNSSIAKLEDALELIKQYGKYVDLDIKQNPHVSDDTTGHIIAKVIKSSDYKNIIASSFYPYILRALRNLVPDIQIGLSYDDDGVGIPIHEYKFKQSYMSLYDFIQKQYYKFLYKIRYLNWFVKPNWSLLEFTLIDDKQAKYFLSQGQHLGAYTIYPKYLEGIHFTLTDSETYELVKKLLSYGVTWFETDDYKKLKTTIKEIQKQ